METVTRIKICGITNADDAQAAVDAGADALGFIAVPNTPRFVASDFPHLLALPPFVRRVIVARRAEDADDYRPELVQFYEDTPSKSAARRGFAHRIRAFRIRDEASLRELAEYPFPGVAVHLDTFHDSTLGGSGETFNWQLAVEAKKLTGQPLILAGGLTPENVADALEIVRPYAVDVSSGVETSPGVKDHAKVRAFVRAVRTWDLQQRSNEG